VATRYQFLHALYQEVLYERIPAARRSRLHRLIGERIEAAYGTQVREIAAELAVHFEQGRDYRRAVQYLQQAGENAVQRSAHQEAITLLTKGLELLKTLPDTSERIQQELRLQITLGGPLIATKGYSTLEVEQVYTRARELCRQLGETPQLFPVLYGLTGFSVVRGEIQTARELSEQLLRIAQSVSDPFLLVTAHTFMGGALFYLREFESALEHFEQGVALYDPQKHHAFASLYGVDNGLLGLCYVVYTLWQLGYPDQALARMREALALAQKLSHPYTLAVVLLCETIIHQFRREAQATQEAAEATLALCSEQGFGQVVAQAALSRGWALVEQGQGEEGIAQIQQGLSTLLALGVELFRSDNLGLLAAVYRKVGRIEEGLRLVDEALNGKYVPGWLYWLKGELTLQKEFNVQGSKFKVTGPRAPMPDAQGEVEACFLKVIEIARKRQARSWELRATMSLARLWQQQGKRAEARQMLAEIYGWFTEGFDTKDLQEAKALLEELSQ
jgi:predicted ATPase